MKRITALVLTIIMAFALPASALAQEGECSPDLFSSGDGVYDCRIDFAALCASGATEVTDSHFTGIGVSGLNPAKGGWYCQAANGSGMSISVNGENLSEIYIETYVNLIWTSNLNITIVSQDGLESETIVADTDNGKLLDDEGNVLASYGNSGSDHKHKIGILAASDYDEAWIYFDGTKVGAIEWTVDLIEKVDFIFGKTVEADLRPWIYDVTVTSDSEKFPEAFDSNPDGDDTESDDEPEDVEFAYNNDFSQSLSDEYMISTKNLQLTSGGVVKYGVGGNWGNMVISNFPKVTDGLTVRFDIYNNGEAYFKLILTKSDQTTGTIILQNGVDTVNISSGQSYSYDSSVMNEKFATVEAVFDVQTATGSIYITDSAGSRTLIADDISIDVSDVISVTCQVEARTPGKEPLFDNLYVANYLPGNPEEPEEPEDPGAEPEEPEDPEEPEEPEILDTGAEFLSFSIEEYKGKISGNTITVTIKGKSLNNLRASFTVGTDVKVYADGELQESGVTKNDFRELVVYTVVAPNGEEREYTVKAKLKESSSSGGGGGSKKSYSGYQSSALTAPVPLVPEPYTENPVQTEKPDVFTDIADAMWAKEYIEALYEKKIAGGNGDGSFEPNRSITREEFVKLLVLSLGIETGDADTSFGDVDSGEWYAPYIAAAVSAGIVNGISEDAFGVSMPVTRQQMITMIYRAFGDSEPDMIREFKEFSDLDEIDDYASEAFEKLYCAGVIDGISETLLAPNQSATRAQAAKLIYNLMENLK